MAVIVHQEHASRVASIALDVAVGAVGVDPERHLVRKLFIQIGLYGTAHRAEDAGSVLGNLGNLRVNVRRRVHLVYPVGYRACEEFAYIKRVVRRILADVPVCRRDRGLANPVVDKFAVALHKPARKEAVARRRRIFGFGARVELVSVSLYNTLSKAEFVIATVKRQLATCSAGASEHYRQPVAVARRVRGVCIILHRPVRSVFVQAVHPKRRPVIADGYEREVAELVETGV